MDPDKEFVVCTNACKRGLGGVHMQEGQIVCYESQKLNDHKQNYPMHNLELATIIHTLKMWRHYLLGKRFTLMSIHSVLRYLFDQPNLNVSQARWLDTLSQFDFEIRYIKGKENRVVDSLSRKVQVNHIATSSYELLWDIATGDQDADYRVTIDGLVRFRDKIYVSNYSELKKLILREFHTKPYSGHPGYEKTLTVVKKFYYWLNLKKEVEEFVARCLDC
eukprot:PITA_25539